MKTKVTTTYLLGLLVMLFCFTACDSASQEPDEPSVDFQPVDMGLPSGTQWAPCNVGANKPEEYGNYYAWGVTEAPQENYDWKHYKYCAGTEYSFTKYCSHEDEGYNGFVDNKTTLEPMDDAATVNWGGNWRMPTRDEINELRENCDLSVIDVNGVSGFQFTSKINGNSIFFPFTGTTIINPQTPDVYEISGAGTSTTIWTSSREEEVSYCGAAMYMRKGMTYQNGGQRNVGCAVRPVWKN